MSSNSRAKTFSSALNELLIADNKITELHTIIRSLQGPQIGARPLPGTGRVGSVTDALQNPDVVLSGIISYSPKLLSLSSTSIDISQATDTGFTSRLILANSLAFDLETIAGAEHAGQYLEIQGVVTESITIKDSVGNIRTQSGNDVTITDNQVVTLRFDSVANQWIVVTDPTASTSFIGFTADDNLNMGAFDILNVDRYIPTIDSGAFPFSFTPGILLSASGLHYNVASLKFHKFQEEEVDQLVITGVPSVGTSLQGNNMTEVDDFFFTTTGTSILHDSTGIDFTLPFGDRFEWLIDSILEFTILPNQINFEGNDTFDMDDLRFVDGGEFRTSSSGWDFRLPLNDLLDVFFNGVLEYQFSPTSIVYQGNKIQDLNAIEFEVVGQSINSFSTGITVFVPNGDTIDFNVDFGTRFSIGEFSVESQVDIDLNDNDIQKVKTHAIHENFAAGFAPSGVTDTSLEFSRPSGAGKTQFRVIFQTGISQLIKEEA